MKHFSFMNANESFHPERSQPSCFWVAQRFSAAVSAPHWNSALAAEVSQLKLRMRLAFVILASVLLTTPAFAVTPNAEARFNSLGHRMMCTCGCGQILLECNHVGCRSSDKMRDQLQAALDRGDNDDLILQGFVQEYGPTVIAAPTATGFNRVAWIMPFVALAPVSFLLHGVAPGRTAQSRLWPMASLYPEATNTMSFAPRPARRRDL